MIAVAAPDQLSSFTAALDEAISRWVNAAENESSGCLEQELSRVHALKSVTSALGSRRIADACEGLADPYGRALQRQQIEMVLRLRSRIAGECIQRQPQKAVTLRQIPHFYLCLHYSGKHAFPRCVNI